MTRSSTPSANCSTGRSRKIIDRRLNAESTRPVPATVHVPAGLASVTASPTSTPSRSASGRESHTSPDCGRRPSVTVTARDGSLAPGSSMATSSITVPAPSTIGAEPMRTTEVTAAPDGMASLRATASSNGCSTTMSVPGRHQCVTQSPPASAVRTSTLPTAIPNTGTAISKMTRSVRPGRRRTSRRARREAKRNWARPISRPLPAPRACPPAALVSRRR